MMDREYEMLLISELELKVLLAALGCEEVSGPFWGEEQASRREILLAVTSLLRRENIILEEDSLLVIPELLSMLQCIVDAERCLVIRSETGRICCCYGTWRVAILIPFEQADQMLRMIELDLEEVPDFLEQEGFFAEPPEMIALPEQQLWEEKTRCSFTAELRNGDALEGMMKVLYSPLRGYTIWIGCDDAYGEEIPFEKECWREQIKALLTGDGWI